jgi:diguanylate cyclase (GGDEF)-like protein
MTNIAEAGLPGAVALVAVAAVLLAATRTRWLRLHDTSSPLSAAAIAIRVLAIGITTGLAVVALLAALAIAPTDLAWPEPWAWGMRAETFATVGLVLLIYFLDGEVGRSWLLLGSSLAAGAAAIGTAWLEGLEVHAVLAEPGVAFTSAVVCTLLLCPGPTTRLVSRVRRAALGADEVHVLLIDPAGHIQYVSDAARAALRMGRRRSRAPWSREALPRALQGFLDDAKGEQARFRTAPGQILEARMVELGQQDRWRRTRAMLVRDVTREHRDERRLVQLAHYDSLTGLANRRLFLQTLKKTLESAETSSRRTALFYIDLDDFKVINDSFGHAAGDAMLKTLADRFRTHLRPEEVARFGIAGESRLTVARLAGDEFAVIAPDIPDGEAAGALARFMLDIVRRPFELGNRPLNPSASIGLALFPEHGRDVETLLRHADSALYVAKGRGGHRFAWYEDSFDAKADRARLVEAGLRTALDRGEMCLHYQPKVGTASGELVGFEALLRWKSPELGDVGPAEFIPIAEARGLVTRLGSWCLDEACRQLREWQDAGLSIVPVSVNVSSVQFSESDLQRVVSEALKAHRVDPRHLELELTESLLLDERNHVEQILRDLRTIGVRVALDDFGTGYSALTYLNRFSLDVLKMDRGLLRDIASDPSALGISSAVVAMAHSLGLSVVAEGIDSEDQLPILREINCDHIQGFLFAPALPAREVARFMSRDGETPVKFSPGMSVPGRRQSQARAAAEVAEEPALRSGSETAVSASKPASPGREKGRVLLVDDGRGSLGSVAMRLGHLGIDIHYASALDEAHLFVAQERDAIRLVAFPPTVELERARGVLDRLAEIVGERRCCIVIGERPDEDVRLAMRASGVDWVLWAPFNDTELRYVVKSAMTLREELVDRREVRVPVDLVANIQCSDRREVAVVSSLSPLGAFVELSDPLPNGSSMRIEIDLGRDRFRGFARVIHVQTEDPERPNEPSGMGVKFYSFDRDEQRLLRKAVSEIQSRYLP